VSCGQFPHPPGTPEHAHPAAGPVTEKEPAEKKPPGPVRAILARNKETLIPFAYIPGVDAYATVAHFASGGGWNGVLAAVAAGAVAETTTEIRNKVKKRRPAVRKSTRKVVAAATAWTALAGGATPAGWDFGGQFFYGIVHALAAGSVQWALLGGGAAVAGTYVARQRKKPPAPPVREEEPVALPPAPDPRQVAFDNRFCAGPHAPLKDAAVTNFTPLTRGFSLEVFFPEHSPHTIADVTSKIPLIAKLYDTSLDNVSVGYVPEHRSEARAKVIVHERIPAEEAKRKRVRFDGRSTYDPAAGTVEYGTFTDDARIRYLFHVPRSGAGVGMAAGAMGAGKTAVMNRLVTEAGLMMACVTCGGGRTCFECDMWRICAVFAGTAQPQSMGVWKGKTDLFASGPEGCLELLQFLKTVADDRSLALDTLEWTDRGADGQIRHNVGKGWFDPEPGFPLIFAPISEFPLLINHDDKVLSKEALTLLIMAFTTWRKVGIHVMPDGQFVDMSQMGARELREAAKVWNLIAMRLDKIGSSMADIKGDPTKIGPDEVGAGFAQGPDDRSDVKFQSDWYPEYNEPGDTGVDVRHMAEVISRTPIEYDSSVLRAMDAFGLSHQQVITEWKGRGSEDTATVAAAPAGGSGPGLGGLPTREEAEKVRMALQVHSPADVYRLMEVTSLSLLDVGRSLDLLTANGDAVRVGEDQYKAA